MSERPQEGGTVRKRYVVLFDIPGERDSVHLLSNEDGVAMVFWDILHAHNAVRGHLLEDHAVFLRLDRRAAP